MQLSNTFLKVVKTKVNDCSNPMQLRALLNQYASYVMSEEIKNVFLERIDFFRDKYSTDHLFLDQLDDLEEDLSIDVQIAKVCQSSMVRYDDNMKKIARSHYFGHSQEERDYLIDIFKQCSGDKDLIVKILKISHEQLSAKVKHYNLSQILTKIRSRFREY